MGKKGQLKTFTKALEEAGGVSGALLKPGGLGVAQGLAAAPDTLYERNRDVEQFLEFVVSSSGGLAIEKCLPVPADRLIMFVAFLVLHEWSGVGAKRSHVRTWLLQPPKPAHYLAQDADPTWGPLRRRAEAVPCRLLGDSSGGIVKHMEATETECRRMEDQRDPVSTAPATAAGLAKAWLACTERQRRFLQLAFCMGSRMHSARGVGAGHVAPVVYNTGEECVCVTVWEDKVRNVRGRTLCVRCNCADAWTAHDIPRTAFCMIHHDGGMKAWEKMHLPFEDDTINAVTKLLARADATEHALRRAVALAARHAVEQGFNMAYAAYLDWMGWDNSQRAALYAADLRKLQPQALPPIPGLLAACTAHTDADGALSTKRIAWVDLAKQTGKHVEIIPVGGALRKMTKKDYGPGTFKSLGKHVVRADGGGAASSSSVPPAAEAVAAGTTHTGVEQHVSRRNARAKLGPHQDAALYKERAVKVALVQQLQLHEPVRSRSPLRVQVMTDLGLRANDWRVKVQLRANAEYGQNRWEVRATCRRCAERRFPDCTVSIAGTARCDDTDLKLTLRGAHSDERAANTTWPKEE